LILGTINDIVYMLQHKNHAQNGKYVDVFFDRLILDGLINSESVVSFIILETSMYESSLIPKRFLKPVMVIF
jgi:hypothetical protein